MTNEMNFGISKPRTIYRNELRSVLFERSPGRLDTFTNARLRDRAFGLANRNRSRPIFPPGQPLSLREQVVRGFAVAEGAVSVNFIWRQHWA